MLGQEFRSFSTGGKLATVWLGQECGVAAMMLATTSFSQVEPFCSILPMWTARSRVRMTTRLSSSVKEMWAWLLRMK